MGLQPPATGSGSDVGVGPPPDDLPVGSTWHELDAPGGTVVNEYLIAADGTAVVQPLQPPPVPDAALGQKGVVALGGSGDLDGTAAAPTVPALAGKQDISAKNAANGYPGLTAAGFITAGKVRLQDAADVDATALVDGKTLTWNAAAGKFVGATSALGAESVKAQHLTPAARGLRSTATGGTVTVRGRTMADSGVSLANLALTSGTLRVQRDVFLPGGLPVSRIRVLAGSTAAVGMTNRWACLIRVSDLAVVAKTADGTSWTANQPNNLDFAAPFTPPDDTEYAIGFVAVASTMPTLCGANIVSGVNALRSTALSGTSTTGLTDPASLGATAAAIAAVTSAFYAEAVA